jgi:hypothetical protein
LAVNGRTQGEVLTWLEGELSGKIVRDGEPDGERVVGKSLDTGNCQGVEAATAPRPLGDQGRHRIESNPSAGSISPDSAPFNGSGGWVTPLPFMAAVCRCEACSRNMDTDVTLVDRMGG